MSEDKPKLIAIVGTTASGKTATAIEIAKQFNGEVISADSRQIYRELDIGTAKATKEEMANTPHHLIDIKDVDESYSAAEFKADAEAVINKLITNKKLPIVAGGTFFYLDTLLGKSTTAAAKPNPELRDYLNDLSVDMLYDQLATLDPKRAKTIESSNKRRLVRALEIVNELGEVPPNQTTECPYKVLTIGLEVEKEKLRNRFKQRATNWLEIGFQAEVESLLQNGISRDRLREIGFEYSLMLELIDSKLTEEEFIEQFIQKNWQYAKRQMTWLKRDDSIQWFAQENISDIQKLVTEFLG